MRLFVQVLVATLTINVVGFIIFQKWEMKRRQQEIKDRFNY